MISAGPCIGTCAKSRWIVTQEDTSGRFCTARQVSLCSRSSAKIASHWLTIQLRICPQLAQGYAMPSQLAILCDCQRLVRSFGRESHRVIKVELRRISRTSGTYSVPRNTYLVKVAFISARACSRSAPRFRILQRLKATPWRWKLQARSAPFLPQGVPGREVPADFRGFFMLNKLPLCLTGVLLTSGEAQKSCHNNRQSHNIAFHKRVL
jgi:hypothetical protein